MHLNRKKAEQKIMDEWKEHKLGDIAIFKNGKSRPAEEGTFPIYGGNGILGYTNQFNSENEVVVIGRVGAYCGSVYYENRQIWISDNALSGLPKNNYNTKFLFYLLKNLNLNQFAEGSSHPLLTQNLLNSIDVQITNDIEEQKSIASILSSLDDKIDLLHHQNQTLEALAETLFRQWFVEEAEERWETTTFAEHTEVARGLSYKGSGLSDESNGIPMHNLNSVYEGGGYKYEGIKYYKGDFRDRHVVKPGDVIVANTEQGHEFRLIGFPAVVPNYFGKIGIFSQHIYKLSIRKDTYLTSQFVYYLIKTPKVREQIIGATNGSTVNMLAIDGLQITEFNLPPKNKVLQFSQMVEEYWQKKEMNYTQIHTLNHLRDMLLPKLMSGEVRMKDTQDFGGI